MMDNQFKPEIVKRFINYSQGSVLGMRRRVLILLFIFVDFFLTFIALVNPYEKLYVYLLIPIFVVLHVFALYIIFNPYKRQMVVHLYYGILGIGSALGSLICAQKIVYSMWGVNSPLFLILSSCTLAAWVVILFQWHFGTLRSGDYWSSRRKLKILPRSGKSRFISGMSTFGVFLGIIVLRNGNLAMRMSLLAAIYLLVAGCASFLIVWGLHRYVLMLRHREWVKFEEPVSKNRKRNKRRKQM